MCLWWFGSAHNVQHSKFPLFMFWLFCKDSQLPEVPHCKVAVYGRHKFPTKPRKVHIYLNTGSLGTHLPPSVQKKKRAWKEHNPKAWFLSQYLAHLGDCKGSNEQAGPKSHSICSSRTQNICLNRLGNFWVVVERFVLVPQHASQKLMYTGLVDVLVYSSHHLKNNTTLQR